jgi:hypothetical protein
MEPGREAWLSLGSIKSPSRKIILKRRQGERAGSRETAGGNARSGGHRRARAGEWVAAPGRMEVALFPVRVGTLSTGRAVVAVVI